MNVWRQEEVICPLETRLVFQLIKFECLISALYATFLLI